jgi:hypothetical protein
LKEIGLKKMKMKIDFELHEMKMGTRGNHSFSPRVFFFCNFLRSLQEIIQEDALRCIKNYNAHKLYICWLESFHVG